MRVATGMLLALVFAACGASAAPEPTASGAAATSVPATNVPTQAAATDAAAGAIRWEIVESESSATVRVREQLATIASPVDAVLATSVAGAFTLLPDGTFDDASRITVDLTRLESDSAQRDRYVRSNALETSRYPTATFVPTATSGLSLPLTETGEVTFTLTGLMSIHGVEKEVSFEVTARRDGETLRATAVAVPTWTFADFGMSVPRAAIVLSVVDEIRLEIELVAREV